MTKTMTLDEYISNQPEPPTPVAITPVRPCFQMLEGGLLRTRPGPALFARHGSLETVARAIDAAKGWDLTPDDIVTRAVVHAVDAEVVLSFLLFISALTRDASDLYRANCPCVDGEALARFQTFQDIDDFDDREFGPVQQRRGAR